MFLEDIGQYLQDNGIGKLAPANIAAGEVIIYIGQQGQADDCLTLIPTGGQAPGLTFTGRGLEEPSFQLISRGKTFVTAWNSIYAAYKLLHGSNIFSYIAAQQAPAGLGKDDQGRQEFSCNFKIIKSFD